MTTKHISGTNLEIVMPLHIARPPRYLLATLKEVTHEQVVEMQRELDEYKSVMGSCGLLVLITQEMLDQVEKIT